MNCPRCGTEHDGEVVTCSCGYDAVEISELEVQLQKETFRRNVSVGAIGAGLVLVAVPATMAIGAGLAFIIAPVFVFVNARRAWQTRKKLHAAKTPKQLPEARIA